MLKKQIDYVPKSLFETVTASNAKLRAELAEVKKERNDFKKSLNLLNRELFKGL